MKLKNYLISNNKNLKIDKAENFTTDIHLFNHLKKNNKIFFKSTNQRNNFSNYKKDYNLIKKKGLNYSKNILTFLKKYHKYNYSNLFWSKLLNEQLYRLTLCIYDFYLEFKSLKNKKFKSNIYSDDNFNVPNVFSEIFENLEYGNEYRDQLLKIFLINFDKKKINNILIKDQNEILKKKEDYFKKKKTDLYLDYLKDFNILRLILKNKIKKLFNKSQIQLAIIKSYFHINYRLILENDSDLKIRTMNFPKIDNNSQVNYFARDKLSSCIKVNDKFDFFFKESIKFFFPKILLENFENNKENSLKFFKNHKYLRYIINESFLSDDYSAFNLAIGKEFFNVQHIYNEHNYLSYILFGNRINELSNNVDLYFSMGWKNKIFPKVKIGANLSILKDRKKYKKKFEILFLPSSSFSRKPYFANYISKETGFEYYKSSLNFLKNLNKDVKNNLSIKLHPKSFDHLGFDYYYKRIKDFKIIKKKYTAIEFIKQSNFVVIDHYSTLFIELMKLNVPFILILGDNFIYQSNYKFNDFESLIKNQVIHLNADSASKFINKIYGKHLEWWASKKVKISVENFRKNNFGNEDEFIKKILELSKK